MSDANALVQAADGLCGALQNPKPESNAMKEAVNALVKIFTTQAEIEQGPTDERCKMRITAQRQRVQTEEANTPQRVPPSKEGAPQRVPASQEGAPQRMPPDDDEADDGAVLMPGLEVTYPSLKE